MTLDYIYKKYGLQNGKLPIQIPDTDRTTLAELFQELSFTVGAEIGTLAGVYAEILCKKNPSVHLYCVDPWMQYSGYKEHVTQDKFNKFFEQTQKRLKKYNVTYKRDFSVNVAKEFKDGSLDFVYIDGNHELQHVINDLYAWAPKVRKGGIIAGHDYRTHKNNIPIHVVQAIHAYTSANKITPWFVLGSKEYADGQRRDKSRSWFFVV